MKPSRRSLELRITLIVVTVWFIVVDYIRQQDLEVMPSDDMC